MSVLISILTCKENVQLAIQTAFYVMNLRRMIVVNAIQDLYYIKIHK
jgi:hypothetical protein